MSIPPHLQRYSPDLDEPHKEEKQTADAISKTMIEIADKMFADGGHAIRAVQRRVIAMEGSDRRPRIAAHAIRHEQQGERLIYRVDLTTSHQRHPEHVQRQR